MAGWGKRGEKVERIFFRFRILIFGFEIFFGFRVAGFWFGISYPSGRNNPWWRAVWIGAVENNLPFFTDNSHAESLGRSIIEKHTSAVVAAPVAAAIVTDIKAYKFI